MSAPVPTALLALALIAIACLLALFIANHLRDTRQRARTPRWPFIAAIALGLLVTAAVRPYFLDKYRVWYVETHADKLMAQLEGQQPLYRAIRLHEPALYQQIRTGVLEGMKRNASGDELTLLARAPVDQYLDRSWQLVPDQELIQLLALTVELTQSLATVDPRICVEMVMGRNFSSLDQYMSSELRAREAALMETVVAAEKAPDRARLGDDERSDLVLQVIATRAASSGIPVADFMAVGDGTLPPPRACAAAVEFLKGVLDLPPAQAAALWRSLIDVEA